MVQTKSIVTTDSDKGGLSMGVMDGVILTLLNTVVCLALPKLLSAILAPKGNRAVKSSQPTRTSPEPSAEILSFP